jgi:hypothetical protein
MKILDIRSTFFPTDPLSEKRWLRHIAGRDLNLEEVNKNTFIGKVIVENYEEDPEGTVKLIRDIACENYKMVENVIGCTNLKKCL